MDLLPFVDFGAARAVGLGAVRRGPDLSRDEVRDVVEGLRTAAAASEAPVAEVTRLGVPASGEMLVVERRSWVRANLAMVETMLVEASGVGVPRGIRQSLDARASGAEVGAALGVLSSRMLGQYLPFGARPTLLLVAPNVAFVERALGAVPADFRLWVCLHEQTHRLQFAAAPWLRGHLIEQVGRLLAESSQEPDPADRGPRASSFMDLVFAPAQRVVFDEITAVMSLLEGYADVMMDRVGPDIVPTVDVLRAGFEARRRRGGWTRIVNKLSGLNVKLAQYRDGAAFCRAVIGRVGVDGLNLVYSEAAALPSLRELYHPDEWLARVHAAS